MMNTPLCCKKDCHRSVGHHGLCRAHLAELQAILATHGPQPFAGVVEFYRSDELPLSNNDLLALQFMHLPEVDRVGVWVNVDMVPADRLGVVERWVRRMVGSGTPRKSVFPGDRALLEGILMGQLH
jgi:hypothetical protein